MFWGELPLVLKSSFNKIVKVNGLLPRDQHAT